MTSPPFSLQPGTNTVPDLSSRDLQAICTLADCGSFMAAALTLNVSQSALTRTVQRVEATLGLELFKRTTRRVEISPAGVEFVELATRMLSDLRIAYQNMRDISDEHRGTLVISAVMSVAYTRMPQIIAQYHQHRPHIEIELREGIHGNVLDDIRSGIADLGITYLDGVPQDFVATPLGDEVFHVVMPANHPLGKKSGIQVEDLASAPLVSMPRSAHVRKLQDGLISVAGLRPHHAITVHQFATVMQCVHAGVGIALVPSGAVPSALSTGLISRRLIKPRLTRAVGMLTLKDRSPTPAVLGFSTHLQANWHQVAKDNAKTAGISLHSETAKDKKTE